MTLKLIIYKHKTDIPISNKKSQYDFYITMFKRDF